MYDPQINDRTFWQVCYAIGLFHTGNPEEAADIADDSMVYLNDEEDDATQTREDAQDAALHHPEPDSVSHDPE